MALKYTKDEDGSNLTQGSTDGSKSRKFESVFGFTFNDLSSWSKFVCLMNRPCHSASLAVFRVCYGAFGILLGFLFRVSCLMFVLPYWYILLLDRSHWNNHSYLFGLVSVILSVSDANRYWSLDGLIWKHKRNAEIPLWNYFIPRFQLYILYFIAGLKKFDSDWIQGYSVNIASNWVFAPLSLLFFNEETVNMIFVHKAGQIIDLTLVYLLFFDATRGLGLILGFLFNFMNAINFRIGMFPYMCIVSLPLFCSFDWPVYWFRKLPRRLTFLAPLDGPIQPSNHCIYSKESIEAAKKNRWKKVTAGDNTKRMKNKIGLYHKFFAAFTIFYAVEQLFLPYSHFLTQGYNDWTQGNYGYSWNMMIQYWTVQHVKITYIVKHTGEVGYIRPNAFINREYSWCAKADLVKLYAKCLERRLVKRNKTNIEIYIDIWASMTKRFVQRVMDPRVNVLTAKWDPFKKTTWRYPLLDDLEVWRDKIIGLMNSTTKFHNRTKFAFVADFPGHIINNYVQEDINDVRLNVLQGKVQVVILNRSETYHLTAGDSIRLPSRNFHKIKTISENPSCFYYTYRDLMAEAQQDSYSYFVERLKAQQNVDIVNRLNVTLQEDDSETIRLYKYWILKQQEQHKYAVSISRCTLPFSDVYHNLLAAFDNIRLALRIYKSKLNPDTVIKETSREKDPKEYELTNREEIYNEHSLFYQEVKYEDDSGKETSIPSHRHSSFLQSLNEINFTQEMELL